MRLVSTSENCCSLIKFVHFYAGYCCLVIVEKMVALSLLEFVMKYFKQSESPDELLGALES